MHKKSVRWTAALCAAGLMLAGCGPVAGDSGTEKIRLMVWSPSEDQSKDSGQWLQTCCENFAALHPEWDITFVYGVADEASAAGAVAQDPEASADVFMYANDTLTTMTDANALAKFGGIYAEKLKATNSETLLDSLTLDGNIYGVPFTTNTWYMYYDKIVFTEEDVKSLDAMLEKGVVSFPFVNSWYLPAFYFGNGCTLFGDGTQEELGADFGGEKAVEVTEYLVDLVANPNFKIDQDGSGLAGLRDGSINAIFSGSWDAAAVQEILGDDIGVAALPTYTLNGEEKQMYAYAGSKAIGVNTATKYMKASVELATMPCGCWRNWPPPWSWTGGTTPPWLTVCGKASGPPSGGRRQAACGMLFPVPGRMNRSAATRSGPWPSPSRCWTPGRKSGWWPRCSGNCTPRWGCAPWPPGTRPSTRCTAVPRKSGTWPTTRGRCGPSPWGPFTWPT